MAETQNKYSVITGNRYSVVQNTNNIKIVNLECQPRKTM